MVKPLFGSEDQMAAELVVELCLTALSSQRYRSPGLGMLSRYRIAVMLERSLIDSLLARRIDLGYVSFTIEILLCKEVEIRVDGSELLRYIASNAVKARRARLLCCLRKVLEKDDWGQW